MNAQTVDPHVQTLVSHVKSTHSQSDHIEDMMATAQDACADFGFGDEIYDDACTLLHQWYGAATCRSRAGS